MCPPKEERKSFGLSRGYVSLAEDLGAEKLCVASDCQVVVKNIEQRSKGSHGAILHEILERKARFQSCKFIFKHRNFNFEAHNLAKFACNLDIGRHVWLGNPHDPNLVPMSLVFE